MFRTNRLFHNIIYKEVNYTTHQPASYQLINTVATSQSNRHLRPLNEMNSVYRQATLKYSILQARIFYGHKDYMEPNHIKFLIVFLNKERTGTINK